LKMSNEQLSASLESLAKLNRMQAL
jgi:hypothetical protein